MVSGLSRTVRGPSMSAFPGKVVIDGVVTINGEKLFALQFLQARNPDWVRRPFFAKFDAEGDLARSPEAGVRARQASSSRRKAAARCAAPAAA